MKSKPSNESLLETECLFGEAVEILDESLDWVYCKLNTDKYCGWVKKNGLGKLNNPTHRIITNRSFVYTDKNPKSKCLLYLSLGSKLSITSSIFLAIVAATIGDIGSNNISLTPPAISG